MIFAISPKVLTLLPLAKTALLRKTYCEPSLSLKVQIMTVADDIHKYFFIVFQRKKDLMFQVNPLLGGFT